MAYLGKTTFFSFLLAGILAMALKIDIPPVISGALFLPISFVSALAIGAQSFTLSRLAFLFVNGAVFFLALARGVGGLSDGLFLVLSFAAIAAVFAVTAHFSSLHKNLPNISREDYPKFSRTYFTARSLILSFLFLAAFIWYADALIVYSVFGAPFYLSLLVIFLVTLDLTSFIVKIHPHARNAATAPFPASLYSWAAGLAIGQISWVAGFWPFGYLTAAFIITIIYYAVAMILREYLFSDNFNRMSAARELLFTGTIAALTFYFTKWLPL